MMKKENCFFWVLIASCVVAHFVFKSSDDPAVAPEISETVFEAPPMREQRSFSEKPAGLVPTVETAETVSIQTVPEASLPTYTDVVLTDAVQESVHETLEIIKSASTPVSPARVSDAEEQFFAQTVNVESRDESLQPNGTFQRIKVVAPPETEGFFYRAEETVFRAEDGAETVLSRTVMDADQVMVKLQDGVGRAALEELAASFGGWIRDRKLGPNAYLVHLVDHGLDAVPDALERLNSASGMVHCAESDFLAFSMGVNIPDDAHFTNQWNLHNTGQFGATPDADIDAPEAWVHGTGSRDIKICVLDSGTDFTHEDLQANIWTNAGEAGPLSTNGVDDDLNGYIDDYRGWNFARDNNNPSGEGHGIGIHGVIGATGDNGIGMAGVCWDVSMIVVNVGPFGGSGQGSITIDAMNYAVSNGCRVFNASWGIKESQGGYNEIFCDAIDVVGERGALFVAAAGNFASDNDAAPIYPASYDLSNIIAVAATDSDDLLVSFSCYGAASVDLAAPGKQIYTPAFYMDAGPNAYTWWNGTSFAAPQVAGACAWLWSLEPDLTPLEVKARIMDNVDPHPSLAGKCVSGGRLNMAALYSAGGDADGDGLPDSWEITHYGSTNVNPNAMASNGVNTVRQAYIAGLDPTNPTNRFHLSVLRSPSSVLSWNAASGRVYSVYWSSNLLSGFQPLEANVPWTNMPYSDTNHTAKEKGFYKIEVELLE